MVRPQQLCDAWREIVKTPEIERRVFDGFTAWERGQDWQVGRFHRFDRWLLDLRFDSPPKPWSRGQSSPSSQDDGYWLASKADPKWGYGREK